MNPSELLLEECKAGLNANSKHWNDKIEALEAEVAVLRQNRQSNANSSTPGDDSVLEIIEKECKLARSGIAAENQKWNQRLDNCTEMIHIQNQYSRKNDGMFEGFEWLPNLKGYDFIDSTCKMINNRFPSLRGKVHPIHIDDAHPLPSKKGDRKTVIVRFSNRWVKDEIFKCKKDLKGTPITLKEHLTPHTRKLKELAGLLVGNDNVSIYKTIVYAKFDNRSFTIKSLSDLKALELTMKAPAGETLPGPVSDTAFNGSSESPPPPANEGNDIVSVSGPIVTSPSDNEGNAIEFLRESQGDAFILNYPELYSSLFNTTSRAAQNLPPKARGKVSRNGRGRRLEYRNSF